MQKNSTIGKRKGRPHAVIHTATWVGQTPFDWEFATVSSGFSETSISFKNRKLCATLQTCLLHPRQGPFRILLTGATGYVGGRLLKALEGRGYRVRCLARRPEFLRARVGAGTEVVQGDVLDANSLGPALAGVAAYYLVHSMGSASSFEEQDRIAASNFGQAAREAGTERIIYLGGLGEQGQGLCEHLRSRQEVGEILRELGVPVIEFRSSVVIGSGSVSFEMVRALVDRLPVMICPKWVKPPRNPSPLKTWSRT